MSENGNKSQIIEYTKCPKCGTLFDVSDIDFSDSQGWVQCGDCTEQFDAAKNSVNYSALLEQSILANMEGSKINFSVGGLNIDNTIEVASQSLSQDVDVLEGAIFDDPVEKIQESIRQNSTPSSVDTEDFVISKKDFITETNAKADQSIDVVAQETSFITEEYTLTKSRFNPTVQSEQGSAIERKLTADHTVDLKKKANAHDIDIEPELYRELRGGSKSIWSNLLIYALAIPLVLTLGLILLMQLQNRGLINLIPENMVTQIEQKAPFLASKKSKQVLTDVSKIKLTATKMERHPTKQGYVNVVLQLTNTGDSTQVLPPLEISFTNNVGETAARKVFNSDDYLSPNTPNSLKSYEAKSITLTFDKLPQGSVGYEVRVIEPKR